MQHQSLQGQLQSSFGNGRQRGNSTATTSVIADTPEPAIETIAAESGAEASANPVPNAAEGSSLGKGTRVIGRPKPSSLCDLDGNETRERDGQDR